MADLNFQFGDGKPQSKAGTIAGRVFLVLFATPFAAFGLFAIWGGINKAREGKIQEGIFICLFGLVFSAVGFGLMYFALSAGRRQKAAEAKWVAQTDGGNKVWLARPDWAAGRIKSANTAQTVVLGIMAAAFCGMGSLFTFLMLPEELHKGNYPALLVLIFPLVGLGLFAGFVRAVLAKRRFGDCFFELAQIPAPLGGSLDGLIQTGLPIKLEQGLHLKLSCLRRTVSGSGKNRSVHESILWQDEKVFRSDASLPMTGSGGSGIPVHFVLPGDQPESYFRGESTIIWRLEATAKMSGPDFSAVFEVPVFRVAGTVPVREKDSDPTASLQMSAEEIRRDEHSKIQVTVGPGGREFYFPAARNLGTAVMLTVFLVIWSGFLWMMIRFHAPILFPIIFGLFEVFIFWGCLAMWIKSSRVTIDSSGVTLKTSWLMFVRTRRFEAGEISRFDFKVGMTSGSTAFHDIKLVTHAGTQDSFAARKARYQETGERPPLDFKISDPGGITLASSIASRPETEWLVREMTRALGRKT